MLRKNTSGQSGQDLRCRCGLGQGSGDVTVTNGLPPRPPPPGTPLFQLRVLASWRSGNLPSTDSGPVPLAIFCTPYQLFRATNYPERVLNRYFRDKRSSDIDSLLKAKAYGEKGRITRGNGAYSASNARTDEERALGLFRAGAGDRCQRCRKESNGRLDRDEPEVGLGDPPYHRSEKPRFPQDTPMMAHDDAELTLYIGHASYKTLKDDPKFRRKDWRWKQDLAGTRLLNDFQAVMGFLFARQRTGNENMMALLRDGRAKGEKEIPPIPDSELDVLLRIWHELLPHRTLSLEGEKVSVLAGGNRYDAKELSDGERVIFYLLGQCLLAPRDALVIIDEPESHVHRSILAKLWSAVEDARPDCTFLFITQDLDFAATRVNARKIWVKGYDGREWDWEEIPGDIDLPEAVIFEVLGTRRPVLFTEGDRKGLDQTVYSLLYSEATIIPRGSSQDVVTSTRALR